MTSNDEYFQWFDENHYDDGNFTLPNHFVTCFQPEQRRKYRDAIDAFEALHPEKVGNFELDTSGQWNRDQLPALLCWSRDDLPVFWKIFEATNA